MIHPKVVILCGGRGVRAFPFTEYLPKPMLPVGGSPILMHIIRGFAAQGFTEFVLAAGYRKTVLDDYFHAKDLGVKIAILDTGDQADTGERVRACREHVGETFIVTYGDGLCDVPIHDLVAFHHSHGLLATVTCVPLFSQYGIIDTDEHGVVTQMREKPVMHEHWINAGFIVMNRGVFECWEGRNLEREVFSGLVRRRQLAAFRHAGFFKSVDSYKDQQEFDEIVASGNQPWTVARRASA